ncbi:MAG: hypothetical protein HZB50_08520 [Chloroflexi bacterium]|nr:hypothetical protein [Chloroflexota bacterium]
MNRRRNMLSLFAIALIVLSSIACQTIIKAISPNPSSSNPIVNNSNANLTLDWLATADELNSLSTEVGIIEWKLIQDFPGENRICRSFQGVSWSATPNEGMNCIFKAAAGTSFDGIIQSMFTDGQLLEGEQPVNSTLSIDGEFAVYAGTFPTGHSVFDLILFRDNRVYWSSVTLGTPAGATPQAVYESAAEVIDRFLVNIVNINLERSK